MVILDDDRIQAVGRVDKEVGTVAAGKKADIVAVRGDVLRHPDLLQDVDLVIKGGVRYT